MAGYDILFKESVYKDLRHIPKTDLKRILAKIEQLGHVPHPPGSQKLTGAELYRFHQGNYRIVYTIEDVKLIVCVVKVGHRKEIYRQE